MNRRILLVALASVVALAASCGGGDEEAANVPGDSANPEAILGEALTTDDSPQIGPVCRLATDEEISAIVDNAVVGADINATLCEYSLVSGDPGVDGTAVDVFANEAFDEVCDLEFSVAGASDEPPVDGVGTIAYWKGGTQTAQLFVCTGAEILTITQYKPSAITDDEALARARSIAEIVLSGL